MDDLTQLRATLNDRLDAAIAADPVAALPVISELQADIELRLRLAVHGAAQGASWASIGDALGMSRQGAHQRFKQYTDATTAAIKAEHQAMKAARRVGDHAGRKQAKAKRDQLARELRETAKAYTREVTGR